MKMTNQPDQFVSQIQENWDKWNLEGTILYREDTLSTRELSHNNTKIHLLHNACRDVYDRMPKSIDLKGRHEKPFNNGSNPEIARSKDGYFKVLGNRFACMQYQSVLVPLEEQQDLSIPFFRAAINITRECPQLTLIYKISRKSL